MRKLSLRLSPRKLRLMWIVLGALLLMSATPLWLYHRQVLQLSEQKLQDTERVQQTDITRSLASETLDFEQGVRQQLLAERQMLTLTGWIDDVNDATHAPQISRLLQEFANDQNILYVTAVNREAKGQSAGSFHPDPFMDAALRRAFTSSFQGFDSISEAFGVGRDNKPALVMSIPLTSDGQFAGMFAAVVSLGKLESRLRDASEHNRTVYIVDGHGRLVAFPDSADYVPGRDVSSIFPIVKQVMDPKETPTTVNMMYSAPGKDKNHSVQMIGTYSPIQELRWTVIAQRSLDNARADAGVEELTAQALSFVMVVTIVALSFGYLFALGITRPIQSLVHSTRAISRAEFHERAPVRGAAEISELAETFNHMAGDIEEYVDKLKIAANENRELFLGSIRMIAAAVDEKDPYTRGHSGRVAKYSTMLGDAMGLSDEDLDTLKISALLHDVGKIGVDDRVLKKPGKLTDEEFELMKQHTVKGANIMRPVAQLKDMIPGIELHHERMDGNGYPYGLAGDQIPMMARIIAVADTLDAITTNRPYQSAMDLNYAVERISTLAVSKYDARVVAALEGLVKSGRLRLNSAALVEV
ncbi:MAG TPA: HD domain-containing phosphohydrolase [Candidatus Acidoferrales bacterium]|nr:HD domain-containing phosphohydrolase [Candidatus Acidoferrales bacterium]